MKTSRLLTRIAQARRELAELRSRDNGATGAAMAAADAVEATLRAIEDALPPADSGAGRDELETERTRYRELFQLAPDGYLVTDETGGVTEANRAAAALLRERADRLRGQPLASFVTADQTTTFATILGELRSGRAVRGAELRLQPRGADPIVVSVFAAPVLRPDGALSLRWIVHDVTEQKHVEASLRRREQEMSLITGSLPAIIAYVDGEQRFGFVNARHADRFGWPDEGVTGRHVRDVLGDAAYRTMRPRLEMALGGRAVSFEQAVPRPADDDAWIGATYVPDVGEDGTVRGVFALITDITDRKRTEAALSASEARLRSILASTLDPVVTIDDHGIIQSVSDSIHRVLGWRAEELVGRNIKVLMTEPHRSRHDEYLANYRLTGVTNILGRTREFEARHADGHRVPIEISVARAELPGETRPLFTGIIRDISERKQAEAALAESERRLREMLTNVELLAVTLDRAGRITFCNDFLLRLTGWARDETLGHDWFDLCVPPHAVAGERERFRAAMDGATTVTQRESTVLTRRAEQRLVSWNDTLLRDPVGAILGATRLGVDVTERRRDEEELRRHREELEHLVAERTAALQASHEQLRLADRLASMGTLVAGLGHDMNNVLLPVRSRLEVIEAIDLPPPAREHLEAIRNSVAYLQQLTDGLHLLALDPDDPEASAGTTEVSGWWQHTRPLLARLAPDTAEFTGDLSSAIPAVAVAPHRLTQAVLNLVINAAEVVPAGGHVRVWARSARKGRAVEIGVTDDGPGMPAEIRRRALEPFFTTKKRGLGTGLGLSLVHGVAKSAGGSVTIDSEVGRGTTVVLELPAATPRPPAASEPPPDGRGAHVSIADPRIGSLVSTFLRAADLPVQVEGPADPASSVLWIMEPATGKIQDVERYLAAPGCRVIVCNPDSERWQELGAIVIEDVEDFALVRRRIGDALEPRAERTTR